MKSKHIPSFAGWKACSLHVWRPNLNLLSKLLGPARAAVFPTPSCCCSTVTILEPVCRLQSWLVVSISLKYMSQLGWLFQIYGKIKHVPNHQSVQVLSGRRPNTNCTLFAINRMMWHDPKWSINETVQTNSWLSKTRWYPLIRLIGERQCPSLLWDTATSH